MKRAALSQKRRRSYKTGMISVVIPALNAEARLGPCLDALVGPAIDETVKQVVVVDGGSTDKTKDIADGFGATVLTAPPGRGGQLKAGAAAARGDWLLFLHADTVLDHGWAREAEAFMGEGEARAGVFTLRFDARGLAPKIVAAGAMARTHIFKSPYGDQGLLISRRLYDEIGGYRDIKLFEDVDIVRRLVAHGGRGALHVFAAKAVTSAERYEREGYAARVLKNLWLLARYRAGAAPDALARDYR